MGKIDVDWMFLGEQLDLLPFSAHHTSLQRLDLNPTSFLLKGWPAASGDGARPARAPFVAKSFSGSCMGLLAFGVRGSWSKCVDTQADCVDTTGFNCSNYFLGQSSSVDTQMDCVDITGCFFQNMLLGQSSSVDTQVPPAETYK
ncbi:hypothetical protein Taro_011290 [Colocasia esculenta]|uniref:Uncharacterized protein n=1 Tax=Colocasia esculenta TaxID=4460 RepID=A0A843UFL2_COLES|nr:hypothetical protein [Colocasia esculenta]